MWSVSQAPQVRELIEPVSFTVNEFTPGALNAFEKALHKAHEMEQPVVPIKIQSDGGRADILFGMMSQMLKYRELGMQFAGIVSGTASSAGCCIFLYCDYRFMGEFSALMFHSVQLGLEGPLPNVRASLEWSHAENDRMNEVLSKHLKKNKNWLKNQMKKIPVDDWNISPQVALELGLATSTSLPQFNLRVSAEFSIS